MKSVLFHALLALLGLGFAYQTWTRKPEEETVTSEATVVPCDREALQQIRLDLPTHSIVVEPQRDQSGTHYWVTVRRKSAAEQAGKPKEQVTDDAARPHDATKSPTEQSPAATDALAPKRFVAKAGFESYLKRVAPLRAVRSLGRLAKDKLAAFGFDAVGTHLELSCAGHKTVLEVGERTFGSSERYLRDEQTQIAYLFDDALISDLQGVQYKFMQSDLHAFAASDVDEATVEARGAKKRLLHRDRTLGERALWVDASQPARRNELYGNWFHLVSKLRVKDFLAQGAEPGSDLRPAAQAATPVLTLDYMTAGKPKGKLELVRVDANGTPHYYARTETTQVWVAVYDSDAKDVERDIALVVGLEEPARASAPAAQH
ncbi:MAG TPA: DUF4340 domain-containing protein [Polyangiales bacterium]